MGFEVNGVPRIPPEQRLNVFALVIYVPDPLGRFLDDLRLQLVPDCNPHAHVSVLPPRPIAGDWMKARDRVRSLTADWTPFEITLGNVGIFPITNVVYLELNGGAPEMHRLHATMNTGLLEFDEPFTYHPHLTLAQEVQPGEVGEVRRRAQQMWEAFEGPRSFRAERATFVQNTLGNCWIDLAEYLLGQ
ncbi:MAG: 2'-5' RNA ligase family protein [Acidobacteria bacterium]|nr:2'-5' RNA ligase family protein [Acidobacteriota bacterium]